MSKHIVTALLAALIGALAGCSEPPEGTGRGTADGAATPPPAQAKAAALPRVAERFEVGESVYVRSLLAEPERRALWVGTSAGVHEVDLDSFEVRQTFTREDGLANEYVFAIGIDQEGYKWFGTNAGGASRYKDGEWQTYFPLHGLADYWVYSFDSQRDGTFWIGTWAGANSFDLKTREFGLYVNELVNEWVYGLDTDSQDRVWFGTEGGVSMFDGSAWRSWTHADGLGAPNTQDLPPSENTGLGTRSRHDLGVLNAGAATYNPNYVFSILVDPQDRVWAGTWGAGVSVYDGTGWRNFTTEDGLVDDIVYAITRDRDGALWFGTAGGVSRYDGEQWHSYTVEDGLINNHVYTLAASDRGIWVGTRGGVTLIAKEGE